MDGATIGLIGGIFGSVVGTLAGIIATYVIIKRAEGPLERAFMIRYCIVTWLTVLGFLFLLFTLPKPFNWVMWFPYLLWMLTARSIWRKKHTEVKRLESGDETFTSKLYF